MSDTTINAPSSSLKLYYSVTRFAWQHGEHYLGFTSDLYFSPPSSHIYETCENFLCWETEWIALPAHRSAAEAASISILTSGELCSGEVAANERSESATGFKRSQSYLLAGEDLRNTFKVEGTETRRVPAQCSGRLLGGRPELILFDDIVEKEQQEEIPLFEDKPSLWVSAISSSVIQNAVNGQVQRIIGKIDSLCMERHFIAWPPESCSPLLFVMNYKTGVSYHGQADNFCEVYDVISPEMLYFYSTADEEF